MGLRILTLAAILVVTGCTFIISSAEVDYKASRDAIVGNNEVQP